MQLSMQEHGSPMALYPQVCACWMFREVGSCYSVDMSFEERSGDAEMFVVNSVLPHSDEIHCPFPPSLYAPLYILHLCPQ